MRCRRYRFSLRVSCPLANHLDSRRLSIHESLSASTVGLYAAEDLDLTITSLESWLEIQGNCLPAARLSYLAQLDVGLRTTLLLSEGFVILIIEPRVPGS